MKEPKTSKQTIYGTWEEADEIPYYPNVFERIWNWITKRTNANGGKDSDMKWAKNGSKC